MGKKKKKINWGSDSSTGEGEGAAALYSFEMAESLRDINPYDDKRLAASSGREGKKKKKGAFFSSAKAGERKRG